METLQFNLSSALLEGNITKAREIQSQIKGIIDTQIQLSTKTGMILSDMNTTEAVKQIFNFDLTNDADFVKAINKYKELIINTYSNVYDKLFLIKNNIDYNTITNLTNVIDNEYKLELDYAFNRFFNFYTLFVIIYSGKIKINPKYIFNKLKIMYEDTLPQSTLNNLTFCILLLFTNRYLAEIKKSEIITDINELIDQPISYYNNEKNVTENLSPEVKTEIINYIKRYLNNINDAIEYIYKDIYKFSGSKFTYEKEQEHEQQPEPKPQPEQKYKPRQ